MRPTVRAVTCAAFGLAVAGWAAAGRPDAPEPLQQPRPAGGRFATVPETSCSAASCHGGPAERVGGEYTTWAPGVTAAGPRDPHAHAYRVLFQKRSADMVRLLGRDRPAHRDAECLSCHSPGGSHPEEMTPAGVGCQACHGPAGRWLTEHYQSGWKGLSNREKRDHYGFVPTKNLVDRMAACTGCHVGNAGREVNHDLLAAGHPRLAFEYTRFHFQPDYRRHWQEWTPQPDFEVRAWVIGQAATLRAAADLLRCRAAKAREQNAPWPEFAGYNCYGCHQSVGAGPPRRAAVALDWELWSTGAVGVAAEFAGRVVPTAGPIPLERVDPLQKAAVIGRPSAKVVEEHAAALLNDLDRWLEAARVAGDAGELPPLPDGLPAEVTRRLAGHAGGDAEWDALAARYLGCAAMLHAAGGSAAEPGSAGPVRELRSALRFPPGFDSPSVFGRAERDRVRAAFDDLLKRATPPGAK